MSSGELGVVVGDFISSIFILDFCDGIVLGFFRGGHVTVVGVLEVGFSSIALIEVVCEVLEFPRSCYGQIPCL